MVPYLTRNEIYVGRVTPQGVYDFEKFYSLMRKFFYNICYKYKDLQYVWAKHLVIDCNISVHWHILMWREEPLDIQFLTSSYAKVAKKNLEWGYDVGDTFFDEATNPVGYLRYILGLDHQKNKYWQPPWGGLAGHVVDGNYGYRGDIIDSRARAICENL